MVICNLAPGDRFAKEALRTLKFATRTREIENKPTVHAKGRSDVFPRWKKHKVTSGLFGFSSGES
jgi:hypothetical protein